MVSASMSTTQMQRFVRVCEDQGIKVTRTKKGLLIRFPDGTSTVQHFTNSDHRAVQNQISRFRRAGMTHPNDPRPPKDLPAYITGGSISTKTKQRILDFMERQGYPEAVLSSTLVKETGMDPGWANRALYHSGFRPGPAKNKKVGRPWYTPDEILALKDKPKTEEVAETPTPQAGSAEEAEALYNAMPPLEQGPDVIPTEEEADKAFTPEVLGAIETATTAGWTAQIPVETAPATDDYVSRETEKAPSVQTEGQREFIDTHDSWAPDIEELLGEHLHRMVRERLNVLKAVGIEWEIRVWRKP